MKPIQTRKKDFYKDLVPYVNEYGKEAIRAFYDFWTEHNEPITPSTKLRFEKHKTWQISRRIRTWRRNNDNWNTYGKKNGQTKFTYDEVIRIHNDSRDQRTQQDFLCIDGKWKLK